MFMFSLEVLTLRSTDSEGSKSGLQVYTNLYKLKADHYLGKRVHGVHHILKMFCDSEEFKDQGT